MSRNVFEQDLEDQAGNRIEIAGKCVTSQSQRFQRNRASTGKWIDDQRRFFSTCLRRAFGRQVCGFDEPTRDFKVDAVRRSIPVRKITDELEERLAEGLIGLLDRADHLRQQVARLLLELIRTVFIARIRQK